MSPSSPVTNAPPPTLQVLLRSEQHDPAQQRQQYHQRDGARAARESRPQVHRGRAGFLPALVGRAGRPHAGRRQDARGERPARVHQRRMYTTGKVSAHYHPNTHPSPYSGVNSRPTHAPVLLPSHRAGRCTTRRAPPSWTCSTTLTSGSDSSTSPSESFRRRRGRVSAP